MINSVKDSVALLVVAAVFYAIYLGVHSLYGKDTSDIAALIMIVIMAFLVPRVFAALGASAILGTAYDANKSKYSLRTAIFNEDKKSSIGHGLVVIFFALIGAFVYPIALVVSALNLKDLFKKDEAYELASAKQEFAQDLDDMTDPTVKGNKKYKLHVSAFTSYYFYTKKEALEYAILNNIDAEVQRA